MLGLVWFGIAWALHGQYTGVLLYRQVGVHRLQQGALGTFHGHQVLVADVDLNPLGDVDR
jgi:hypothetical protein